MSVQRSIRVADTFYIAAIGGDFDVPGCRYGPPRVAATTRGSETEGHPVAAPRTCRNVERDDLAGLVDTLPRTVPENSSAELPPGNRISGR